MLHSNTHLPLTRKQRKQMKRYMRGLDGALERARKRPPSESELKVDLDHSRIIIFSDQHKGDRSKADDFRQCERAYNSALAYYFELGYTLIVLGDAEELWKNLPGTVLKTYPRTFELEAQFHEKKRYWRIWGNHDDEWSRPKVFEKFFGERFPGLECHESLLLQVSDSQNQSCGELFLVHGHHGSLTSDSLAGLSRFFVYNLYRPFQRITGFSPNTPSRDWHQRRGHNLAMYEWAAKQEGCFVLVAGHTHRPIFQSELLEAEVLRQVDALEAKLAKDPGDHARRRDLADKRAELEWVLAQDQRAPGITGPAEPEKPCFFNSGCCCYTDGDVTGLEIADGQIRLVRWPDDDGKPQPRVLDSASLRSLFDRCQAPTP